MSSPKGQFLGYLKEAHASFKKHEFVLLHSSSADPVKVTSLTEGKVHKEMSKAKVVLLDETTLVLDSESPLSAKNFISQLIKIGSTQLFDIALEQGIMHQAE